MVRHPSPSNHLTSHHLTISPSDHLPISPSHHLTISLSTLPDSGIQSVQLSIWRPDVTSNTLPARHTRSRRRGGILFALAGQMAALDLDRVAGESVFRFGPRSPAARARDLP